MPKKSSPRKKISRKPASKSRSAPSTRRPSFSSGLDEEYAEYLERYEMYGTDRPHLSPSEFDRLDDELLDLLAQAEEQLLSDDQVIRLHELEFLLLDDQSEFSP